MNPLRIVAWDDPRCVQPLEAAAKRWATETGQTLDILRRPLTAFNDQPLAELSPVCDVMIIDYPHIAQALAEQAIIPIDRLLSAARIQHFEARAIGPAQASFRVGEVVAALASDAACHVSAHRPERMSDLGASLPSTWDAVFSLHNQQPGSVAFALYPTDAISCIMSLTAGEHAGPDGGAHLFPDHAAAFRAIERLQRLANIVPDYCWECTPQALFAEAEKRPEIAYIPFTFGYTRKVKVEEGSWRYGPLAGGSGSLLGGAGMAVSSQTPRVDQATAFVEWYCDDGGQTLAGLNWGQPSGLAAWDSIEADTLTFGFYSSTRDTQTSAYVRPRKAWWPAVQDEAGQQLVTLLRSNTPARQIVIELESIYAARRLPDQAGA